MSIDFGEYRLEFAYDFIKICFSDTCHFDAEKFDTCYDLKTEVYGDQKIGILVIREDDQARYSFDPMILLKNERLMEAHTDWVAVVSNSLSDAYHLEFVKQITDIPCMAFKSCEEAKNWVNERAKGNRPNLQLH